MQETRLKELFDCIPTLDELHALGGEGFKADIILMDSEKDKKLSMLKKLIMALVRGLNSNPATVVKKIAGLVCILPHLTLLPFFMYKDILAYYCCFAVIIGTWKLIFSFYKNVFYNFDAYCFETIFNIIFYVSHGKLWQSLEMLLDNSRISRVLMLVMLCNKNWRFHCIMIELD